MRADPPPPGEGGTISAALPTDGCTSSVGTLHVPLRTVITRVPGLRPVSTSRKSAPAASRGRGWWRCAAARAASRPCWCSRRRASR